MSHDTLVARVRGLGTRTVPDAPIGSPRAVEDDLRERARGELAILARWGGDAITPIELDEDRRTLRAIARGLVASVAPAQRIVGCVPTRTIPLRRLGELANATSFADIRAQLGDHPFASAFDAAEDVVELFELEQALARRYFEVVRTGERALATYIAQLVDVENAQAALLVALRGGDISPESVFIDLPDERGTRDARRARRLDLAAYLAACAGADVVRERLARVFAGTPIAAAVFAPSPSAIEDAALAWHTDTQAHLRRIEPLGLAPVLYFVLRRREHARRLRRAAWSLALGGGP